MLPIDARHDVRQLLQNLDVVKVVVQRTRLPLLLGMEEAPLIDHVSVLVIQEGHLEASYLQLACLEWLQHNLRIEGTNSCRYQHRTWEVEAFTALALQSHCVEKEVKREHILDGEREFQQLPDREGGLQDLLFVLAPRIDDEDFVGLFGCLHLLEGLFLGAQCQSQHLGYDAEVDLDDGLRVQGVLIERLKDLQDPTGRVLGEEQLNHLDL